ncbi:MAG: RecQ family ATP-dependent DNA helicase [Candidatus Kapaibacterium sp.]
MLEQARPTTPLEALQQFFGYRDFRPGQEEIIRSVLARRDTMVVMPTGGGKSLCYQVPALLLKGVTIVVSPLIALMKDQVDALARCGVKATTINSTLDFATVRQRMTDIRYGLYTLVYVAPERFASQTFIDMIKDVEIALFAVDEAHCISEWGHDFRPSYMKLREAAEMLGRPPVIALTATATPYVQEDIIIQLGLHDPRRFVRGFDRPNLSYHARFSSDKDADLRDIMKRQVTSDGVSVIYCGTRRNVESVGMMLHAERLPVTIYHAGMPDNDRRTAQELFANGQVKAIVATNAFGMGIDKADVRHVIHYDMPGSIEAYYQEAGRAGRDGKPGDCTLLHGPRDRRLQEFFIRSSFPEREQIEALYETLWDMVHVGIGNRYEGVFVPDEKELAARSKIHPAGLASTIGVLEKNEVLRKIKAERLGAVRFLAGSAEVQEYYRRTRDPDRQKAILALLRTLGGAALGQQTLFNPEEVATKHGLTAEAFERSMRALMLGGLLSYTPPTPGTGYQFLQERLPSRNIGIDERSIEQSRDRALLKLDAVERYIRSVGCRRDFILEYFCADKETESCGRCDNCSSPAAPATAGGKPGDAARAGATVPRPQVTRAIELLLAAALELDGRFGKMTLVDILRGSRNATIDRFGLEGYHRAGELRGMERSELARIAEALLDEHLLESSASLKPTIRITDEGRKAIRHLTIKKFTPVWREAETSNNPDLLHDLRAARDRLARREEINPALICPEALLVRISNELPTNRGSMLAIEEMTGDIYEACGPAFMAIIQGTLDEDQRIADGEPNNLPDRLRRTHMLLREGYSLEEIARRSALQPSTVSGHIEELIKLKMDLNIDRFVEPGIIRSTREQLARIPNATLRELRALLGGAVEYPELRIAAAWIRYGN